MLFHTDAAGALTGVIENDVDVVPVTVCEDKLKAEEVPVIDITEPFEMLCPDGTVYVTTVPLELAAETVEVLFQDCPDKVFVATVKPVSPALAIVTPVKLKAVDRPAIVTVSPTLN